MAKAILSPANRGMEKQLSLLVNRKFNGKPTPLENIIIELQKLKSEAKKSKNYFIVKTVDFIFEIAYIAIRSAVRVCLKER